jgi:hypothetical protein
MKTIFDKTTRDELIARINSLSDKHNAQWGKMNVYQMTKHCSIWDAWLLGKNNPIYKQEFLGKIFGKMALKSNTKDDTPLGKNTLAGKAFTVKKRDGNVETQKKIWMSLIAEYENYSNPAFVHDFFGKMTIEQIGIFAYKHSDHHLRQFNV